MARGKTIGLQHRYFDHIKRTVRPPLPKANITGWNSWYCFHNKLGPEDISATWRRCGMRSWSSRTYR